MALSTRALMRETAQLRADLQSGALRYTSDGLPTRVPTAANATQQLMQQMNAEAVARGAAPSFPSAGAPTRLEAREFVPIPTPAPKPSLPELTKIPPPITSIPPSSSAGIGVSAGLANRLNIGVGTAADFGSRLSAGQSVPQAALGTGLSLGGALAGAEAGAALGTALFPGVGTVIGAAGGGIFGSLAGSALANAISGLFHPKRSSNLPDYLEPRGQGNQAPAFYPLGTRFIVYITSPGRNDEFRVTDVTQATVTRQSPGSGFGIFGEDYLVRIVGSDTNFSAHLFYGGEPSLSVVPLGRDNQPLPALQLARPGDAPSIPANQPYVQPEPIAPVPQPQPRTTPVPNQAPQPAPQSEPAPQPAPRREPSRAPSPSPASKPIPAPADAPQPTASPASQPSPVAQPTSTPGQAGGSVSSSPEPVKARSLNPERFPDATSQPQNNNEPLRAPSLNPDRFPDPTPSTQPDPRSPASPNKSPSPTVNPTPQPKPEPEPQPQPSNQRQCNDPCIAEMQAAQDKNKPVEITVKVFKACKSANTPSPASTTTNANTPESESTPDDLAIFEDKKIKVPALEADSYKLLYARIAKLEARQCHSSNAIAAVPEWWQLRPEAQRSQLVVLYAEVKSTGKLGDSRWTLAIPHYNRPKAFKPRIPDYNKGSWEGILILKDNSKIIVNAKDRTECLRVINALKINVPVEYRVVNGKAIKAKVGERINSDLKQVRVTAVRVDFFSTGQRNMKPDWSIDLRKN